MTAMEISLTRLPEGPYKIKGTQCYDIENVSDDMLKQHTKNWQIVKQRKGKKVINYYNHPVAFDIETSNISAGDYKFAFMYVWMIDFDDLIIVGRKWEEFDDFIKRIATILHLNEFQRLPIYIQNLGFEFQFIRRRFNWADIFSLDVRKPVRALTMDGMEFRCSYALSGYSLATIGKNLTKYKVEKLVGDLDYGKIRNSLTPLTITEWGYNIMDVVVLHHYIKEKIEADGDITKIPMTKTGYVRRMMQNACISSADKKHNARYRKLMEHLTIQEDEYYMLKKLFAGGFTHASHHHVGKTLEYVGSYDETSEYPSVAVSKYFPMSKGQYIAKPTIQEFKAFLKTKCCGFCVVFEKIQLKKSSPDCPISYSKCWDTEKVDELNGRVYSAEKITLAATELDFATICEYYDFESFAIFDLWIYERGYLPKPIIETIMKLYQKKTELKDVAGSEVEYLGSKENINSTYGMMVMDPVQELIESNGEEWGDTMNKKSDDWKKFVRDSIDDYNNSKKRCLFYPWGVWITAHARRNLFKLIREMGLNFCYADTDSGKALNIDTIKPYIEKDNARIMGEMRMSAQHNGIPFEMFTPKTIEGKVKPMGVWDYEGEYRLFKTMGAKRYMTLKGDVFSLTVSGVNKSKCCPELLKRKNVPFHTDKKGIHIEDLETNMPKVREIFDEFTDGWMADIEMSGRLVSTYMDYETHLEVVDYLGNTEEMHEFSSLNLTGTTYSMSLKEGYLDYCETLNNIEKLHPHR